MALTPEQWMNQYLQRFIDVDGSYGAQCADWAEFYNANYIHAPRIGGNAWEMYNRASSTFYTKIANTPSNWPQEGDIIIWAKSATLPYGHVAVCSYSSNVNRFVSYDQNWPIGTPVHQQAHTYSPPLTGWLRPKNKFWVAPPVTTTTTLPPKPTTTTTKTTTTTTTSSSTTVPPTTTTVPPVHEPDIKDQFLYLWKKFSDWVSSWK